MDLSVSHRCGKLFFADVGVAILAICTTQIDYVHLSHLCNMRYTKYLSQIVSSQGVPVMEARHFKTIMNIVHLEGDLNRLMKLKSKPVNPSEVHRFDVEYITVDRKLTEITRNIAPSEFFEKLLSNQVI